MPSTSGPVLVGIALVRTVSPANVGPPMLTGVRSATVAGRAGGLRARAREGATAPSARRRVAAGTYTRARQTLHCVRPECPRYSHR